MMEPKQKATWAEIDVGSLVTPDFVKACIRCAQYFSFKLFVNIYELLMIASSCRVVMCCMRLGDCMLARYDNNDFSSLLEILCHKSHIFFSREAIELLNKLANINGISALCQVKQLCRK